jgi:hypothetical protein
VSEAYEDYVVVKKNKTLSNVVFEYYGNLDFFEEVLELNINAIGLDVFLDQGTKLKLPVFVQEELLKEVEASTLW